MHIYSTYKYMYVLCAALQFQTFIHVVCAILLSSFSTYANVGQGKHKAQKLKVIKNANFMLLLVDSLTLTFVLMCLFFCVCFCLGFLLLLNCCRHHSSLSFARFYLWHKTGNDLCKMADAQLI